MFEHYFVCYYYYYYYYFNIVILYLNIILFVDLPVRLLETVLGSRQLSDLLVDLGQLSEHLAFHARDAIAPLLQRLLHRVVLDLLRQLGVVRNLHKTTNKRFTSTTSSRTN